VDQVKVVIGAEVYGLDKIGTVNKELGTIKDTAKYVQDSLGNIVIPLSAIASVYLLGSVIKTVVDDSLGYLSKLESANLGIAAAYMTGGEYIDQTTGKVLVGRQALDAAQQDSIKTMQELQFANLQTTATLDQLVKAYQETLPVAMAKGFDRTQVKDFTVAMVQAASAIGLPFEQMGEETRSMLTQSINPRNSRIATVLGLRNEDLEPFKDNANELFTFLMGKLDAYKVAGEAAQHTWDGLWSNTKDIALKAGGETFQPVFEAVKYELEGITQHIVTIDEKTKQITWNKGFLDGISDVRGGITAVIAETYRFSILVDRAGGTMTTIASVMLKTAEVATRFMTLGQFGDSFKGGADSMNKWNTEFERRAKESDAALQALANREVGLDASGNPLSKTSNANYKGNPPKKEAADSTDISDQVYTRYITTLDGLNKQIRALNPDMTEYQKKMLEVDEVVAKLTLHMPAYSKSWQDYGVQMKKALTLDKDIHGTDLMTPRQQKAFDVRSKEQDTKNIDFAYQQKEEKAEFDHTNAMIGISHTLTQSKLKDLYDTRGMVTEEYNFEQQQAAAQMQWTLDHVALEEEQKDRILEQYRAKRKLADMKLAADLKQADAQTWQGKLQSAQIGTGALVNLTNSLATLSGNKSKEMFALQKAAGFANAIVNTAVGVTQALKAAPPPYNFVLAGMVSAAGAAQLAVISSASFNGDSSSSGGGYSGGGAPGYGDASSQAVTQPAAAQTQQQGNVTIQFMGSMYGVDRQLLAKWSEEELIPILNQAGTRGVTIEYLNH
jgi:hypothetical protein